MTEPKFITPQEGLRRLRESGVPGEMGRQFMRDFLTANENRCFQEGVGVGHPAVIQSEQFGSEIFPRDKQDLFFERGFLIYGELGDLDVAEALVSPGPTEEDLSELQRIGKGAWCWIAGAELAESITKSGRDPDPKVSDRQKKVLGWIETNSGRVASRWREMYEDNGHRDRGIRDDFHAWLGRESGAWKASKDRSIAKSVQKCEAICILLSEILRETVPGHGDTYSLNRKPRSQGAPEE